MNSPKISTLEWEDSKEKVSHWDLKKIVMGEDDAKCRHYIEGLNLT